MRVCSLYVSAVCIIIVVNLVFIQSKNVIELTSGNRGNWDYTNWLEDGSQIKTKRCNAGDTIESTIKTNEWLVKEANRVILTVEITPQLYCITNKSENSDCQTRVSVEKAIGAPGGPASVNIQNATAFPFDTFFNSSTSVIRSDSFAIENVTHFDRLYFEFETIRFCGYIDKITLEYYECPQVSRALVDFNKTSAPDIFQNVTKVAGTCTNNAALISESAVPYMNCMYDGSYQITGRCVCDPGYTLSTDQTSCKACEIGFYKPSRGNAVCSKCGANAKDGQVPRETCSCKNGFFKDLEKLSYVEADCYAPPGKPTNIVESDIQPYQVTVTWTASTPGTDNQGLYIIKCLNCPTEHAVNVNTSDTTVTLSGLSALANYSMEITKENNVTERTGQKNSQGFKFQTGEGAPTLIQEPSYETLSDGSVLFKWLPPFGKGGKQVVYVVTYGDTKLRIKSTTFTIETDTQNREYLVQIHVETVVNGLTIAGPIYSANVKVNGGIPLGIALAVAFGVMIFVVVVLVAAFCFWKRRNPAYLQVVRMPDGTVKLPSRFYSGGKVYVDPKTYPDVDDAVNEFAFEIMQDELKLGEKIGDGEFAEVYKGVLLRNGKNHQVAVKMLRATATPTDRSDFLSEAAILGQFSDPNVIFLQGVIMKEQPNAIILEFMVNGSLDMYLQEHDMQFTIVELLEMGRGIASGMKYLSEVGFIHRDLAARNILVDENRTCKIADFGMSLEIKIDDTVESLSGKIPVRWTAPEAIQFKKFTTASDVWSYGIVLWEIMSYGERPYWDWTNYEVLEKVSSGYRLPPPMNCPGVVHDLMLQCWTKDRTRRPLFSIIKTRLDSWIRHPDLLEGSTVIELDDNLDYTIMQTINKWLEAISMGRYAKNFIEQGFATPRQILLLNNEDLERLGIGALEHRKRIMKAIQNTRAQVEDSMVRTSSDVLGNPNAA